MKPMHPRLVVLTLSAACVLGVKAPTRAELPAFASKVGYFAGLNPHSVVVVDLDADLDLDLPVSRFDAGQNISILKNNGDGTFQSAVPYSSGGQLASSVGAGDLDGDGDFDLVTVNYGSHSVAQLMNNGDGTFQAAVVQTIPGATYLPLYLACDDFTDDDRADLVFTRHDPGQTVGRITYYVNSGTGTLNIYGEYSDGVVPWSMSTADIDGDSVLDFITANLDNSVTVFRNGGEGTVSSIATYPAGSGSQDALGVDLDGDGDIDLATANRTGHDVTVLMSDSGTGFQPAVHYPAGVGPHVLTAADLDLDGDVELVTGDASGSDSISILENNGDGTFQPPVRIQVGGYVSTVDCAAVGPDLDIDIVASSLDLDTVFVLENLLCSARRGDVNSSGSITSSDIIFLVNYVFKAGPPPACNGASGDVNCSGAINSSDIISLVNYVFKGGQAPC